MTFKEKDLKFVIVNSSREDYAQQRHVYFIFCLRIYSSFIAVSDIAWNFSNLLRLTESGKIIC